MRTHVELRSTAFGPEPDEADLVNPGRWGRALARGVATGLQERDIATGEPIAEDWGWMVPVPDADLRMFVGCGNLDDDPGGFLCFIEPSRPFVRKGLRKVPTGERVEALATALDTWLRGEPAISEVRWWDDDEIGSARGRRR